MPAAIAIPALIGAAGSVGGAVIASRGAKGAAKTQSTAANLAGRRQERATQDALRYIESRRTGQPVGAPTSPYPPGGSNLQAISRLSPTAPGRPPGPVQGGPVNSAPLSIGGMLTQQGQLVTVQAPTGETKQVPAEQAQRYVSGGAKVLQ